MSISNVATYRILSNVLQTTFGKSSEAKYATSFMSASMPVDNIVQFKIVMSVSFPDQKTMISQRKKYRNQSLELIAKNIERIEKQYKEDVKMAEDMREMTGSQFEKAPAKSVKLKLIQHSEQEAIEYLSVANPKKQAFFKFSCLCTVE